MSTILVILIGLGIIVLCGMAIKYSESAVSLLILLPGVANMRAEELLERYNKSGIDSLFNKFSDSRKAISAPKVGEYVQFQEILKVPVNGNETPKSLDDFWGE